MKWFRRSEGNLQVINRELRDWELRLESVPPYGIAAFDKQMRHGGPGWLNSYAWTPETFSQVMSEVDDPLTFAKLGSMHSDGHFRERAVRRLAQSISEKNTLQWLLIRCNDWVPEVRTNAINAIASANQFDINELATCIPLLLAATKDARADDLFTSLRQHLNNADALPAIKQAARSGDAKVAVAAIHILLSSQSPLELLDLTGSHRIAPLRVIADAALSDPSVCEQFAARLTTNKNPEMRAQGLWHLIHHDHAVSNELINNALADHSIFVRALAQPRFTQTGGDCHAFYLTLLERDQTAGLLGLGDCGSINDVDIAISYADAQQISTQHAALRIIASFAETDCIDLLIKHATNDSGAPARQALRGITRLGLNRGVASKYWGALCSENDASAWRRFFGRALPAASKWVAIEFGLRGCIHEQDEVKALGIQVVTSTLERVGETHISAPPQIIPELNELVDKASGSLADSLVQKLKLELR